MYLKKYKYSNRVIEWNIETIELILWARVKRVGSAVIKLKWIIDEWA